MWAHLVDKYSSAMDPEDGDDKILISSYGYLLKPNNFQSPSNLLNHMIIKKKVLK